MIETIVTAMRMPAGGFMSALAVPVGADGAMRMVGPFVLVAHSLRMVLEPGG